MGCHAPGNAGAFCYRYECEVASVVGTAEVGLQGLFLEQRCGPQELAAPQPGLTAYDNVLYQRPVALWAPHTTSRR
jgi:hypothetical protein